MNQYYNKGASSRHGYMGALCTELVLPSGKGFVAVVIAVRRPTRLKVKAVGVMAAWRELETISFGRRRGRSFERLQRGWRGGQEISAPTCCRCCIIAIV